MRRTFNLTLILALLVAGCSSAPSTPAKKFQVGNLNVEFSPPDKWTEDPQKDTTGKVAAVIFKTPSGKGHLAITVISKDQEVKAIQETLAINRKVAAKPLADITPAPSEADKKAESERLDAEKKELDRQIAAMKKDGVKLDEAMVNRLALPIQKRNGKISNQKSTDMAGEKDNATRMDYEFSEGDTTIKGSQMHFTSKGNMYSIVLTVPAAEFPEDSKMFEQVVRTFKVL